MLKNKQSDLIAGVKMPDIGFINKYIINSRIRGEGGYSVLLITNHFSEISFHLPTPQLIFL